MLHVCEHGDMRSKKTKFASIVAAITVFAYGVYRIRGPSPDDDSAPA